MQRRRRRKVLSHGLAMQDHVNVANITQGQERSICLRGPARNRALKPQFVSEGLADEWWVFTTGVNQ